MVLPLDWEIEMIIRLFMSLVLGCMIGLERETVNKWAGLRTHALVSVGSCLVMIISVSMPLLEYPNQINTADPGRIAAQVVSGIGFLGAGAIMRSGVTVKGLTTAATLWVMACIGLAVGAGMYLSALAGTILVYIALTYFVRLEDKLVKKKDIYTLYVWMEDQAGELGYLCNTLNEMDISIKNIRMRKDGATCGKIVQVEIVMKMPANMELETVMSIAEEMSSVDRIEIN